MANRLDSPESASETLLLEACPDCCSVFLKLFSLNGLITGAAAGWGGAPAGLITADPRPPSDRKLEVVKSLGLNPNSLSV